LLSEEGICHRKKRPVDVEAAFVCCGHAAGVNRTK
jgi:hypothetical protein